jgi:hypothetical protein
MHIFIVVFMTLLLSGCAAQTYKVPTSLNLAKLRFYLTPSVATNSSVATTAYPDGKCENKTPITDLGESQQIGRLKPVNAASGGIDAGVPKNPDFTYQKNNYVEIVIEADKTFYFQMVRGNGKIISFGPPMVCGINVQFNPETDKTYQALFNYNEAEKRCSLSLSEVKVVDGVYRSLNVASPDQRFFCPY